MIKAVIFDMDGVIADTERIYFDADNMVLRQFGKEQTLDYFLKFVGTTTKHHYQTIIKDFGLNASVDELLMQRQKYTALLMKNGIGTNAGVMQIIEQAKAKHMPIGLASSSAPERIQTVLNATGLTAVFDVVVSGEQVKAHKPEPDVYIETAKRLGVNPTNCLAIEDSRSGVLAAKAAGMKCVALRTSFTLNQDVSAADKVVNRLEQVKISEW